MTVCFCSISTTLILAFLCHPYVTTLVEIVPNKQTVADETLDAKITEKNDRVMNANRLNILGNSVTTEFKLSDVSKVSSGIHPFGKNELLIIKS